MTEEQIKQNAEEYASKLVERNYHEDIWLDLYDAHIAGAHSRDGEIGTLEGLLKIKEHEIKQLINPWISVKERLPEDGEIVLTHILQIIDGAGEHKEDEVFSIQRYCKKFITDRMEQVRMGGYLFDTISKVTHWMPIPKIEKGK